MTWPKISEQFQEQLEVLRYLARDPKHRSVYPWMAFSDTDKDFKRIINMRRKGRELKSGSYKRLKVSHFNHGTDAWEIRISADRMRVSINKDNWAEFCHWVNVLMVYAPNSAVGLMQTYPNVKVETWRG